MGYRHYFYLVDKSDVDKITDMTKEQLTEYVRNKYPDRIIDYDYAEFRATIEQKEIFEFGKLYYCDTAKQIYSTGAPLFSDKELQEQYSDYTPFIVGKPGLLKAIEIFKQKIISYYKNLLIDDVKGMPTLLETIIETNKSIAEKQEEHIRDILREWEVGLTIDLSEERESITDSWKYEYSIFDLVRLLKSIDWDKNTILFYGW